LRVLGCLLLAMVVSIAQHYLYRFLAGQLVLSSTQPVSRPAVHTLHTCKVNRHTLLTVFHRVVDLTGRNRHLVPRQDSPRLCTHRLTETVGVARASI